MSAYQVVWSGRGPLPGSSEEGWRQKETLYAYSSGVLSDTPKASALRQLSLARKQAGLCVACGRESDGKSRCPRCRDAQRRYVLGRRRAG